MSPTCPNCAKTIYFSFGARGFCNADDHQIHACVQKVKVPEAVITGEVKAPTAIYVKAKK